LTKAVALLVAAAAVASAACGSDRASRSDERLTKGEYTAQLDAAGSSLQATTSDRGRLEAQPLEELGVATPLRPHLDDELEEDAMAEKRLHLGPSARPDLPNHRAALPDEDALL